MLLSEVREFPTTLDTGPNCRRIHESVFRSYQTVEKVIELLQARCPHEIILEIIEDIKHAPQTDKTLEA
jgi:hypothetical protein